MAVDRYERGEKRYLSHFVRLFWAWRGIAAILVLGLVVYVPFALLGQDVLWIKNSEIGIYVWGVASLFILLYIAYTELRYQSFFYILADNELIIRQGVFSTERVVIPYVKIQNVNATRSVPQRIAGTATMKIETAGGNPGVAEGVLPEVAEHEKLMEEITSKVDAARKRGHRHSL